MPDVRLVDTTVRDGHQSLWSANALSTPMIAAIAPAIDRVGYHAIDFTSSTHMAMAVRWQREDPWERIRVIRELMPETPLGFITPGMRFMAWWRAPSDSSSSGTEKPSSRRFATVCSAEGCDVPFASGRTAVQTNLAPRPAASR